MSAYHDGRRVEYAVTDFFRELGWHLVRAASSKGMADVVAIAPHRVALVNCKRTTMPGPTERSFLLSVAACIPTVALPLVALKPSRKPLEFRLLTGPGPKDWQAWEPEHDQGDVRDDGSDDDPWSAA